MYLVITSFYFLKLNIDLGLIQEKTCDPILNTMWVKTWNLLLGNVSSYLELFVENKCTASQEGVYIS